ncbi:MAG: hypothetical protein HQL93_07860 [Magnetococcales bacterium]|nr:hypothetical protein [Magnetococcales bacterium]
MEGELTEVAEVVTGVFSQGSLGPVAGVGGTALVNATQQGAGGAMNSLAIGNAGGVVQSASVAGKKAVATVAKTGSIWAGSSKLGVGKWGLPLLQLAPLLLVGTIVAVGVGVYGYLQYRNSEAGSSLDGLAVPE